MRVNMVNVAFLLLFIGIWILYKTWNYERYNGSIMFRTMLDLPEITAMDWLGPDMAYATAKNGIIYKINMKERTSFPIPGGNVKKDLDIYFDDEGMEMGLVGIALSPHFKNDRILYISYTTSVSDENDEESRIKVMRLEVTPSGLERRDILFNQTYTKKYHHAGTLIFSSGGNLFLSSGDGGPQGDPQKVSQKMYGVDKYKGKIIRLDLSGRHNHQIIALGLRNPWKISMNPEGILVGDVGYNSKERIYLMPSVDPAVPYNFGWPYIEGSVKHDNQIDPNLFNLPQFEYNTSDEEGRATVGGYFLNSGIVIVADWLGFVKILDVRADSYRKVWKELFSTQVPQKLLSMAKDPYTDSLYVLGEKTIDKVIF